MTDFVNRGWRDVDIKWNATDRDYRNQIVLVYNRTDNSEMVKISISQQYQPPTQKFKGDYI